MTAWHTHPLERVYAAVFIDALHAKMRDGQGSVRPEIITAYQPTELHCTRSEPVLRAHVCEDMLVQSPSERVYAGLTPAQRRAERRHALLDAALDEIASAGWRQLRVETACSRAQVNRRYFYELFDDLDDLAGALVDRLAQDAITACSVVPEDTPMPEFAHATLGAFVRHLTDDPRRAAVLFGEIISSAAVDAHRAAALRRIAADVAAHARRTHPGSSNDDPIAELTSSVLVGGTARSILDWLAGRIPMSRDQFIADLTSLWLITGEGAIAHSARRNTPPPESPRGNRQLR